MTSVAGVSGQSLRVPLRSVQEPARRRARVIRVAIVEDDPSDAALVSRWLMLAGHHCQHFAGGRALMRAFDHVGLDAVILDGNLSDVSGVDVLRRIRGSDR